jgi:hypothetical protein
LDRYRSCNSQRRRGTSTKNRRLHRVPNHTHEVIAEGFQIGLVSKLGREGFEGLPRVLLAAVEALVFKPLHSPPQEAEECRDEQGGSDNGQLGQIVMAG